MRHFLWISGIAVFLMLSAFSCTKENGETGLNGKWQWLRTDGGIGFHIHETPVTTGKHIELQLTDSNTYIIYTNRSITARGTYSLETKKCIHDGNMKQVIRFSSSSDIDMMVEDLNENHLVLSDELHDGVSVEYSRKTE